MLNLIISVVLLFMCWVMSGLWFFKAGVKCGRDEQRLKMTKSKRVKTTKKENKDNEKFMRELENLFSYDGTTQE